MYNLIEYNNIYSKTSGSFWQCYINEPALDGTNNITDFPAYSNSISFKVKERNNRANRKQLHKRCWNNGTIKTSM